MSKDQVDRELALEKDKVIAVVIPETYIECSAVVTYIEKTLEAAIFNVPYFPTETIVLLL